MVRHPRAALALLIAAVLTAGAPSALVAAAPTPAATPFDRNLLRNGGFEQVGEDGSPTGWQVQGTVRVERFGDRPWPYPAYGAKYHGGQRYLGCSGTSGLVRQRVAFVDRPGRSYWVKAHLQVDFGGRIHHAIRVSIRATGEGVDRFRRETKPLIITNHYKRAVTWLLIPPGTTEITATVQLVGVRNGARCRMVADTVKLILLRV